MYDVDEHGFVHVDLDGITGVFSAEGDWVRGELREADPHLCGWLAGPQLPPSLARNPKDMAPATEASS